MKKPVFTVIVSTIGVQDIRPLLHSIQRQRQAVEIIVVDQSGGHQLAERLTDFSDMVIKHIIDSGKGASRGRNIGLEHAQGDYINFADDDGWYSDDLLDRVKSFFEIHCDFDYLSVNVKNLNRLNSVVKLLSKPAVICRENVLRTSTEFTVFYRAGFFSSGLAFDENMGVGCATKAQADEGPDLLIRAMEEGYTGYYNPELTVFHPSPMDQPEKDLSKRGYGYQYARGHITKKYQLSLSHFLWGMAKQLVASVGYFLLGSNMKARYYFNCLKGRFEGYLGL